MNDRREAERASLLDSLTEAVRFRSKAHPAFRDAVGTLPDDLAYLSSMLRADPGTWRRDRAFHAVHVPSLLAILTMLEEVDAMTSVTQEDRREIDAALHRACGLVTAARGRVEQARLDATKTELDVLAGYATPPAVPYRAPSLALRTWRGLTTAPGEALAATRNGAAAVPAALGALRDGAVDTADRVSALPTLAANLRRRMAGALSDTVAKPVEMRLQAGGAALRSGLGTGLGVGVACAVLFPPLLPLSAGAAVLGAMRGWRVQMRAALALQGAERARPTPRRAGRPAAGRAAAPDGRGVGGPDGDRGDQPDPRRRNRRGGCRGPARPAHGPQLV